MSEELKNNNENEYTNNSDNTEFSFHSYQSYETDQDRQPSYSDNQEQDQGSIYTYSASDIKSFEASDKSEQQTTENPYSTVYPIPEVKEVKPKKKHNFLGAFKLTAAALAFGLIAGAAFQGYYYVTNGSNQSDELQSTNQPAITQVIQESSSDDSIVATTTASGNSVVTDVSDVVKEAMPSIVAINAQVTTTAYDIFGRGVAQEAQASGSGIIIAQNGSNLLIVTNNHVVADASSVQVTFSDDSTASAEIKGSDENADLAVLSINMNDLSADTIAAIKVATLGDSDAVEAGDMAIAIGNALGYGQSVTVGYISAVNREVTTTDNNTMKLLQTDAAINPGNSGGALLNIKGQVIGINSAKYASTEVEGMGYAIPISNAIPMINELMNRETVSDKDKGYLGIDANTAQNVTATYSERFNMPIGVYVNDVIKGSPAENAGLKQGDIITGLDNVTVETIDDLGSVLSYKKAGEEVTLTIQSKVNGIYSEKNLNIVLSSKN